MLSPILCYKIRIEHSGSDLDFITGASFSSIVFLPAKTKPRKFMEQINLTFNGETHCPPAGTSPEGDCSHVVNLRYKDGAWRPVGLPEVLYTPADASRKIIFVHKNESYEHYLSYDGTSVYYECCEKDGELQPVEFPKLADLPELKKIESCGNTLIFLSRSGISYALFSAGNYQYLGEKPELPQLLFYYNVARTETGTVPAYTLSEAALPADSYQLNNDDIIAFSNLVTGTYNKLKYELEQAGTLSHPVLVKYALRLYDGSYMMSSPAILLLPFDSVRRFQQYKVPCTKSGSSVTGFVEHEMSLMGYKIFYDMSMFDLSKWLDIVMSLDIFVSQEIIPLKQGEFFSESTVADELYNDEQRTVLTCDIPERSYGEICSTITQETQFYLVASLEVDKMPIPYKAIELPLLNKLGTLVHQPTLPSDDFTHHSLLPEVSYIYNGRLHLGAASTRFFSGFQLSSFQLGQPRCNGYFSGHGEDHRVIYFTQVYVEVTIKGTGGSGKVVRGMVAPNTSSFPVIGVSPYLCYPDTRAIKMKISGIDIAGKVYSYECALTPSSTQNEAYYIDESLKPIAFAESDDNPDAPFSIPEYEPVIEYTENKLRVSEVNNPFLFPMEQTYTLSSGRILGMGATVAALSQGQYGEFPLYVFTTEGVWAMQVGTDEVVYGSQHPVNREVCNNPASITPIDHALVYTTDRGVMLLDGSQSTLLSQPMTGRSDTFPGAIPEDMDKEIRAVLSDDTLFTDYLLDAEIGYNYAYNELIILNPAYSYYYVLGIDVGMWYRRTGTISGLCRDYPYALATDTSGTLFHLGKERFDQKISVALVSRALKFLPNIYKKIRRLFVRVFGKDVTLKISLWGAHEANSRYGCLGRTEGAGYVPGRISLSLCGPSFRYYRLSLDGKVDDTFFLESVDFSLAAGGSQKEQ